MEEIKLTNGFLAIVDDEDLEKTTGYKWYAHSDKSRKKIVHYAKAYVRLSGRKNHKTMTLHRLILNAKPGQTVDHINGNGLDNRKENLRFVNKFQNQQNRGKNTNNTSGFKGVWHNPRSSTGGWYADIYANGPKYRMGPFKTALEAHQAYVEKAKELHGEFANYQ